HDPPVRDRRQRRVPVHEDEGTDGQRPPAREGNRAAEAAGPRGRPGSLHRRGGAAQPRRDLGTRNHRSRLRLRPVRDDGRGADRMTALPTNPRPKESQVQYRRLAALGAALALVLCLPAAASAHISVHPNTVPAGAYATLDVRVPGEQEGAYVTKLDMLLPPGFTSVDYANVPGGKVSEVKKKLNKPVQTDDGPISEEVSQIIWTWTGPLNKVENGQFIQFPLSVAIPDNGAGTSLKFKTVQN